MTSGAVLFVAFAAACKPRWAMAGSESGTGISSVQEQCRRFLVEMNGRGNFDAAALCRSKLPTAICREGSQILGAQPWALDRVVVACQRWEGEWATQVFREAAAARGLDLEITASKKPRLPTLAPVPTLAPLPTLAPVPMLAPPPLLAPTPSAAITKQPSTPHQRSPVAPVAPMDHAAHRKGPVHAVERANPWGKAPSSMEPYLLARVVLPVEVAPRPHSGPPPAHRLPTHHRAGRPAHRSRGGEPTVSGQVVLKVLHGNAVPQTKAYRVIHQALAEAAGVETSAITLSGSAPENGMVAMDYRIKLTSTVEMTTAAFNLATTRPKGMTGFIRSAAAGDHAALHVKVQSLSVLDSTAPAGRKPPPHARQPRHTATDFPPLPSVPDPRIDTRLRVPKSHLVVLGSLQFRCNDMNELRLDKRVQDALHQAVVAVLHVPLRNMTVNSVQLTPLHLLSAEAYVEVYFTVQTSSRTEADKITEISQTSSTLKRLDADIHRRLLAAGISNFVVQVSSFAAEGASKVQQALHTAAPEAPEGASVLGVPAEMSAVAASARAPRAADPHMRAADSPSAATTIAATTTTRIDPVTLTMTLDAVNTTLAVNAAVTMTLAATTAIATTAATTTATTTAGATVTVITTATITTGIPKATATVSATANAIAKTAIATTTATMTAADATSGTTMVTITSVEATTATTSTAAATTATITTAIATTRSIAMATTVTATSTRAATPAAASAVVTTTAIAATRTATAAATTVAAAAAAGATATSTTAALETAVGKPAGDKPKTHEKTHTAAAPAGMLGAWSATLGRGMKAADSVGYSTPTVTLLALASCGAVLAGAALGMRRARQHAPSRRTVRREASWDSEEALLDSQ
eukprot:CAMPEP_0179160028 /NCGR_PEP_ID=MMETSP0796-20121207/78193_1 /TAXON_ID=73915 /ORGANISM="Pyrodinium bahamense, Strain pbaha01" /LENGTH=868 /DNA_ID=CAMNT_0020861875 /DNA_START=48 /DNA_END=2654 /DNA_ORIENTATION=+